MAKESASCICVSSAFMHELMQICACTGAQFPSSKNTHVRASIHLTLQQRAHYFQHLHLADPNWIRWDAVLKQTVRGKRGSMWFSRLADSNLALQHCREPLGWWGWVVVVGGVTQKQWQSSTAQTTKVFCVRRAWNHPTSVHSWQHRKWILACFSSLELFFPTSNSIVDVRVHVCGSCGCLTFTGVHSSVENTFGVVLHNRLHKQCRKISSCH